MAAYRVGSIHHSGGKKCPGPMAQGTSLPCCAFRPLPPLRVAAWLHRPILIGYPHAFCGVYGHPRLGVWVRDSLLSRGLYGHTL